MKSFQYLKVLKLSMYFMSLIGSTVYAYELRTHAALTFEAYKRSNLAQNPKILENLGFTTDKAQQPPTGLLGSNDAFIFRPQPKPLKRQPS